MLKKAGFEPLVYEDFYDIFKSLVDQIVQADAATKERLDSNLLLEAFQEPEGTVPDAVVAAGSDAFRSIQLCRHVPALAYLRSNPHGRGQLLCLPLPSRNG